MDIELVLTTAKVYGLWLLLLVALALVLGPKWKDYL